MPTEVRRMTTALRLRPCRSDRPREVRLPATVPLMSRPSLYCFSSAARAGDFGAGTLPTNFSALSLAPPRNDGFVDVADRFAHAIAISAGRNQSLARSMFNLAVEPEQLRARTEAAHDRAHRAHSSNTQVVLAGPQLCSVPCGRLTAVEVPARSVS